MSDDYIPFNWFKLSSPMTPMIWLRFRGADFRLEFPNRTNRIYIENAEFAVLDDNAASSATITLADPDFVHLEALFLRALFLANSSSRENHYWYCAINWGWTFYGPRLYNPNDTDEESAQYKMSGTHHYMLSGLEYNMDEVELRVTINLIDIGRAVFGPGDEQAAQTTIGRLSIGDGVTQEAGEAATGPLGPGSGSYDYSIDDDLQDSEAGRRVSEATGAEDVGFNVPGGGGSGPAEGDVSAAEVADADSDLVVYNVFTGLNNWEIIQRILGAQDPPIEVDTRIRSGEPRTPYEGETDDPERVVRIPETANLRQEIDRLLREMPTYPSQEEIQSIKDEDPEATIPATKHWDILAGGAVTAGNNNMKMVFGWVPDPPTRGQELSIADTYRLARVYTYIPGTRAEMRAGETQILSLNYDWTSQGYWGLNIPRIYGLARNANGNIIVVYSEDDWRALSAEGGNTLVTQPPSSGSMSMIDAVNTMQGVQIDFNFDTNTESDEKITTQGQNIIVNVWNFFLKELLDVDIEVPGDPFLDNRMFSREGSAEDDELKDLLVDLYEAYFIVKVYKMTADGGRVTSPLFDGKYLCLRGCTHRISEGEYTTQLRLIKAF